MRPAFLALLAALFSIHAAFGQSSVATDPVGFTTTTLLGSSDTFVSIPFTRPPEFTGAVQSISGSPANTITVIGSPGWTTNRFVYAAGTQPNHYYVLIGGGGSSNPKQGHTFIVNANGSNTLTVTTTVADDLSGVTANTQIVLIPYWTPTTIFPASDAGVSFTPTTSPPAYQTLIRVPDYSAAVYSTYAAEYYFNGGAWRRISDGLDHGDDPLVADGYFVIRNANGAPTLPLINVGAVALKKFSMPLLTATGHAQDNPVSILRPLDIALDATGLGPADGSFVANDQLLVFDNGQAAFDKSPSGVYYYNTAVGNSGGWRLTGDAVPSTDRGADIIPMGAGFVIRKAQTGGGQTAFWTDSFPVQAITAVSRKTHGSAGTFDLTLPLNLQFNTRPGIESRVPGQTPAGAGIDHQIVLTFPTAVSFSNITPTSGTAAVQSFTGNNSNTVTINLSNVSNAQRTTITLLGVNDGINTNDVAVQMGVLLADVNSSARVDAADVSLVRQQTLQPITASNFREDINATGRIDAADVSIARQKALTSLP